MSRRRTAQEVAHALREADRDLAKGLTVPDICRKVGIAQITYRRIHALLVRGGWTVNIKRVHRLCNSLGLRHPPDFTVFGHFRLENVAHVAEKLRR